MGQNCKTRGLVQKKSVYLCLQPQSEIACNCMYIDSVVFLSDERTSKVDLIFCLRRVLASLGRSGWQIENYRCSGLKLLAGL